MSLIKYCPLHSMAKKPNRATVYQNCWLQPACCLSLHCCEMCTDLGGRYYLKLRKLFVFSLCGLRGLPGNEESWRCVFSVKNIQVKILFFIYTRTQTWEFAFSHLCKPLLSPFSFLELNLVTVQEPPSSSETLPGFFIPAV